MRVADIQHVSGLEDVRGLVDKGVVPTRSLQYSWTSCTQPSGRTPEATLGAGDGGRARARDYPGKRSKMKLRDSGIEGLGLAARRLLKTDYSKPALLNSSAKEL